MARIIVFNNDTNRMENYYRNENEAMPYNANRSLTVPRITTHNLCKYFVDNKKSNAEF